MRVVQVYKDFEPPVYGGIEHTMRLLAEGLSRTPGVDSTVLCSSDRSRTVVERIGGVQVVRAATFGRLARAPVSPSLPLWLHRLRPDVLHFHFPNPTGEMAWLVAGPRCPVVLTYHADIVRQRNWMKLYRYPLRAFLGRVDRILVTTERTLEDNALLAPHLERCEVVPSGISTERLQATPRSEGVARELRAQFPGPRILFVGRLRPYKGVQVLMVAMERVAGTLLIVGRGEAEAELKRLAGSSTAGSRIVFAGDVDDADLAGYYRSADLFVLPSVFRNEAFGLAMVEAMYCGLPVISTRLGTGTSLVNQAGITGLEVPPADPGALVEAMNSILGDPATAHRMGEAGALRARTLTSEANVERTLSVYRRLCRPGSRGRLLAAAP